MLEPSSNPAPQRHCIKCLQPIADGEPFDTYDGVLDAYDNVFDAGKKIFVPTYVVSYHRGCVPIRLLAVPPLARQAEQG